MDESDWTKYLRKAKWVVIALLAPEAVVFAGFEQWVAARSFLKELQHLYEKNSHGKVSNQYLLQSVPILTACEELARGFPKDKFDMEYAMYAVMGGFIVEIGHLHNKLKFATLNPNGILLLAKEGKFVSPYPGSISSKSQMDILTKAFLCCQVLSFLGQVIERKVAHLTISLLELNTAVHIVGTVVMYAFWIRKPYNIQDPTLVALDDQPDLLAFIVTSSQWPQSSGFETAKPTRRRDRIPCRILGSADPPFAWFGSLIEDSATSDEIIDNMPKMISDGDQSQNTSTSSDNSLERCLVTTRCESSEPDRQALCHPNIATYLPVSNIEPLLFLESGQVLASGFGPIDESELIGLSHGKYQIGLSQKDLDRLGLAAKYMRKLLGSYKKPLAIRDSVAGGTCIPKVQLLKPFADKALQPFGDRLICSRVENWPTVEQLMESIGAWLLLLLVALAMTVTAYGFLHEFANPALLPTKLEGSLWGMSCVVVVLYLPIFTFTYRLVDDYFSVKFQMPTNTCDWALILNWQSLYNAWRKRNKPWRILSLLGVGFFGVVYIASRAFIIVESFISLRHVPIDVYQTPNITYLGFVPHIS
jgi:hypothetical protein